jgi:hypothetical protein
MTRFIVSLAPLALLACTASPPTPQSITARDTMIACRQQANRTFAVQNRDEIYGMSDLSAPQSSIGLSQDPMRGLADQYTQERMIEDCIRNTGTQTNRASLGRQGGIGAPTAPVAPNVGPSASQTP